MTESAARSRPRLKTLLKICVFAGVFGLALVVMDRFMGWWMPNRPPTQIVHPPSFHEQRENLEFSVDFKTNSQGLRSPELPLVPESKDAFRIAFAGDSFTEGHGVELNETYPLLIEDLARQQGLEWRSVNCGISGAGPARYGRVLLCAGLRYRPQRVVIAIHTNDVNDTSLEDRLLVEKNAEGNFEFVEPNMKWQPGTPFRRLVYRVVPWTYSRLQTLKSETAHRQLLSLPFREQLELEGKRSGIDEETLQARIAKIPADVLEACENGRFNVKLVGAAVLTPDHIAHALDLDSPAAKAKLQVMLEVLDEVIQHCRDVETPVAIIYVPTAFQYDESIGTVQRAIGVTVNPKWLSETAPLEKQLTAWCQKRNLPFLSLTETFRTAAREQPGHFNFARDEHWNANGHQLAAKTLLPWLMEKK